MQVQLTSTSKIVTLVVNGREVPARIWEGETAGGVRCHAYITRIAMANGDDATEFARDLMEHSQPSDAIQAIPLRLVL